MHGVELCSRAIYYYAVPSLVFHRKEIGTYAFYHCYSGHDYCNVHRNIGKHLRASKGMGEIVRPGRDYVCIRRKVPKLANAFNEKVHGTEHIEKRNDFEQDCKINDIDPCLFAGAPQLSCNITD